MQLLFLLQGRGRTRPRRSKDCLRPQCSPRLRLLRAVPVGCRRSFLMTHEGQVADASKEKTDGQRGCEIL